jgi:hypothetical protein
MRWIRSFRIELIDCTARIDVTNDPEGDSVHETYTFEGLGDVSVRRYHDVDRDELGLGDFCGVDEVAIDGGRARYRLDTGDAVVEFEAASRRLTVHVPT